jgi:phosphatidylserine/phosphatidylglycerophosphate/cardiolipin synthase-like enzyme
MNILTRCLAGLSLSLAAGLVAAQEPPLEHFTQVQLLTDNDEAWQAKRELIASARETLDLAYFIVEEDASTKTLLQDLVEATRRQPAVRVRLLTDWFQTYRQTALLQALAAHPGIEVRRRGAPTAGLRAALHLTGIDGPRFIAGMTSANPQAVTQALAGSPLFPPQVAATLAGLQHQPHEALGATAMRMLPALAPAAGTPWPPEVRWLLDELNGFLHWTHHKLLLADGQCFIMGGRNLADAYHRNAPDHARPFQDTDVHACDASGTSRDQREAFDALWADAVDVREHDPLVISPAPPAPAKDAPVETLRTDAFVRVPGPFPPLRGYLVNSRPAPGGDAAITQAYVQRIRALTARGAPGVIDIVNAYLFLSGESPHLAALQGSLLDAARAGITVNIRTNSLASTDLKPVNVAAYQTLGTLVAGGIHIYELQPGLGTLHTKAAAICEDWLLVGSYNLDPRSELYDSNNLLALHDPSGQATGAFRQARVHCDCWQRLTPEAVQQWQRQTEPDARMWRLVQRLL